MGAGVVLSLATIAVTCASCAAPRAGASPPRTTEQRLSPISTSDGPGLRIRIARSVREIEIDSGGALSITPGSGASAVQQDGAVIVARTESGFTIRSAEGGSMLTLRGPLLFESKSGSNLKIAGAAHLGAIELRAATVRGAFDAIELVGIESYLPGVVAAELYPGWSPTAFEVQAVTARSYALHERARQRGLGSPFDLENTTIDQAYAGANSSPKAREAVRRTRGLVLKHQGAPLRAYYSSACGGRASSASDTWPTSAEFSFNLAPPLQSRERPFACGFSHHFNWTVERSAAALAKRVASAGGATGNPIKALRSIESISAVEWNEAGRPSVFEVRQSESEAWRVQADTLRHWCNASVKGMPDVPRESQLRSGDIDALVTGDSVQITGRGFGHGVGMCQFGAEGFARRGWSRDRILRLYYPGIEISEAY